MCLWMLLLLRMCHLRRDLKGNNSNTSEIHHDRSEEMQKQIEVMLRECCENHRWVIAVADDIFKKKKIWVA